MNIKEIALYLKIKGEPDEETVALIKEVYDLCFSLPYRCRAVYFPIEKTEKGFKLTGTDVELEGRLASRHFDGCEGVYLFCGTLGMESERKQREIFSLSPKKAVVLDACFSEYLERKLDETEKSLSSDGKTLTSRISCGYGDLDIAVQKELYDLLEARKAGIYMNESFMLTPNKSVIAIVGVRSKN